MYIINSAKNKIEVQNLREEVHPQYNKCARTHTYTRAGTKVRMF